MKTSILATAAAVLFAFPAFAQQQCGPVEGMESHFLQQFGERIVAEFVGVDGKIFALLVNDSTQSWTLVVHDGTIGCMVASGMGVSVMPTGMAL